MRVLSCGSFLLKGNQIVPFSTPVNNELLQLTSAHISIVKTTLSLCLLLERFCNSQKKCVLLLL